MYIASRLELEKKIAGVLSINNQPLKYGKQLGRDP